MTSKHMVYLQWDIIQYFTIPSILSVILRQFARIQNGNIIVFTTDKKSSSKAKWPSGRSYPYSVQTIKFWRLTTLHVQRCKLRL